MLVKPPNAIALAGPLLWLAISAAGQTKVPAEVGAGGLAGYISSSNSAENRQAGYGYGLSVYYAAWPLLPQPISSFQIGLPSTWIYPNEIYYPGNSQLCPSWTTAYMQGWGTGTGPGGGYQSFFQTIEGGLGFWGDTMLPSPIPKYRIGGTGDCYTSGESTPGWRSGQLTALPADQTAIIQLSNRLLVPPDGQTFDPGTNGRLVGIGWLALPLTQPRNFYFQLRSLSLDPSFTDPQNRCLDGNQNNQPGSPGTGAYMSLCTNSSTQLWRMIPAANEFFQLQNMAGESANLCLAGNNGAVTSPNAGAAYMAPCAATDDQLWTNSETWQTSDTSTDSWRTLATKRSISTQSCLDSGTGLNNSRMAACQAALDFNQGTSQLWDTTVQQIGSQLPAGGRSMTLFLNTTNFKGPVAFWMPDFWERIGNGYPPALGRGFDFRDMRPAGVAMEVNTVPMLTSTDSHGTTYTSIPGIQFPVDSSGRTILSQDLSIYSSASAFDPVYSWLQNGGPVPFASTSIDTTTTLRASTCSADPFSFQQVASASDGTQLPLSGFNSVVNTAVFNTDGCQWGLQWSGTQETTPGGMAIFPRYYVQNGSSRVAVPPASVPAETGLVGAAFTPAPSPQTYTSPAPGSTNWSNPGPSAGPFYALLSDGSVVTYYWYRFVDQPALQGFGLGDADKALLQQYAEMIHGNWPMNHDYLPPPTSGTLATLDAGSIVTPPPGMAAGFVPIVTRQGPPNTSAPASITATHGSGQSAQVNTAFATELQATVQDAAGNPVSGAMVTFTAPASGPSGAFGGSLTAMATTNYAGVATAPTFTANGTAGPFTVTAAVAGVVTPAIFSLTNTSVAACSLALSPASANLPATGTSTVETCPNNSGQPNCGAAPEVPQTFNVTPGAACGAWTATSSNPAFLGITSGASGNGPGTVAFTLLNNTHAGQQAYTITVASGSASASYSLTEAGSGNNQVYREVYALYEQLLGRDPDPAGFAFWTGSGGAELGQMADSFLTSPEAFNTDFVVMAVYQAATGQPPTFAQYNAAVASLRAGAQTVTGLFNSLASTGFSANSLYQNLLGRGPGAADQSCIQTGLAQCFQAIVGYPNNATPVDSPNNEFQSTGTFHTTVSADHSNALYARMVYYVTLSRDPDPSGLAFWINVANGGGPGLLFEGSAGFATRIQILGPGTPNQGFIGSPEFQGLFAN